MTVKPLGKYFTDMSKVILVDDVREKAAASEVCNLLVVPPWHEDPDDQMLTVLTELLMIENFSVSSLCGCRRAPESHYVNPLSFYLTVSLFHCVSYHSGSISL